MVTCSNIGYNGRLGNQIFQFALCFGVSKKLGYEMVLPEHNLNTKILHQNDTLNHMAYCNLLECFNINLKYFGKIKTNYRFDEKQFHFDSTVFNVSDNIDFNGYFQSEKYFLHVKDDLLNELKIKPEILNIAQKILPSNDKELVSIHIRRGDYVLLPNHYPNITPEYVENVINTHFNNSKYHFCVFSDDINWCKNIWGNRENFTIFYGADQFVDFAGISLCQHHIISNSTFSWWASYISSHKNKIIIMPEKWFGHAIQHNVHDIYPEGVIKM